MVEITLRFSDKTDADLFLRGVEHGHIDGALVRGLYKVGLVEVVGESATVDEEDES